MLDFQGVYVSAAASELGQVQDTWGRYRTPGAGTEHLEQMQNIWSTEHLLQPGLRPISDPLVPKPLW